MGLILTVGFFVLISYIKVLIFCSAIGIKLFEKKKAKSERNATTIIRGRIILHKEMPAAFIATSSYLSPKLPNVIIEARSIAKGSAIGTRVISIYQSS